MYEAKCKFRQELQKEYHGQKQMSDQACQYRNYPRVQHFLIVILKHPYSLTCDLLKTSVMGSVTSSSLRDQIQRRRSDAHDGMKG